MKNLDLVILAGGKGSRIKRYLKNKPKPMLKFNNIFFLQYLINSYSRYPFRKIIILTGYKNKIIFKNFHNKVFNFTKIICLKEKKPMGTGGALNNLKKVDINDFVLVNGDTIFDIDLKDFTKKLESKKIGRIALVFKRKNTLNYKLNNLDIKNKNIIYKRKSNLMNGGVYYFKKSILNKVSNTNFSLENDLLPKIINDKSIIGLMYKRFFLDIGTPKYLKVSEKKIKKYFKRPSVFLDRDGVINYDYGYVYKKKDFKFKNGVIKGLKYLIKKKYLVFIVTNQAGIAKGYYKESDFQKLHLYLKNFLYKKNIYFDDVQYSPYHSNAKFKKFKKKSSLRKPGNQMIKNIFKKYLIDKQKSIMIGDKKSDYLAAKKSNLKFEYAENNFFKQIKRFTNNY